MWKRILGFHSLDTCFLFLFCRCITVHLLKELIGVSGEGGKIMIWDILLCYSKLALLPTHSVSAKNAGLGLSVVEVSESGSKEITYPYPSCLQPLACTGCCVTGSGGWENRSTEADFPIHIYIYIYVCVYLCMYIYLHCRSSGSGEQRRTSSSVSEHNNIPFLATVLFITAFCQITGLEWPGGLSVDTIPDSVSQRTFWNLPVVKCFQYYSEKLSLTKFDSQTSVL